MGVAEEKRTHGGGGAKSGEWEGSASLSDGAMVVGWGTSMLGRCRVNHKISPIILSVIFVRDSSDLDPI